MDGLRKTLIFFLSLYSIVPNAVKGQDSTATKPYVHETTGFMDFNGYYDTRHFSVLTVNILSKLPRRFEYFSLTNLTGTTRGTDLSTFYTQQNLRWRPVKTVALDVTAQLALRGGENNDASYLGLLWKPGDMPGVAPVFKKLYLYYFANLHIVKLSEANGIRYFRRLEHVYKLSVFPAFLHHRVYISGVADQHVEYNDNGRFTSKWVTEHQIGVMLLNQFYVVLEYRLNEFMPAKHSGFGYGLQYIIVY